MSEIATPDVSGVPSGPRPSVIDGLSGGEYGDEQDSSTLSMTALLAQSQDEPDESDEAPDEGTTDDDETDNSEAGDGDENLTAEQKELAHLKALLGRQSNELGELRKLVSEQMEEPQEQQFVPALVTQDLIDEIESQIEEVGGRALASWAAQNRPDLLEAVLDTWAERSGADARKAAQFSIQYENALVEVQEKNMQDSEAEFAKELRADLDAKVATLAPEYGFNVEDEKQNKLLGDTLEASPEAIQELVLDKDPAKREAGLRAVFAMAVVKAGVTTPEADGAAQDALRTAQALSKGAATIGGGGLKPAAPPALTEEQAIEAQIASRLLSRPSTSVSEGLTGGQFGR